MFEIIKTDIWPHIKINNYNVRVGWGGYGAREHSMNDQGLKLQWLHWVCQKLNTKDDGETIW